MKLPIPNLLKRNPIALFLCKWVLAFALLALPWPGLPVAYSRCFQSLARAVFSNGESQRELTFELPRDAPNYPHVLRITIVNRELMHEDGSGPVRTTDVGIGSQPAALLLALILTTPVTWKRRGWAAVWGMLALHCWMLFFLGFIIWSESASVSLVTLTPYWQHVASTTQRVIAAQSWMVVPTIIWVLVTFRREDRFGTLGRYIFGPASGGATKPCCSNQKASS